MLWPRASSCVGLLLVLRAVAARRSTYYQHSSLSNVLSTSSQIHKGEKRQDNDTHYVFYEMIATGNPHMNYFSQIILCSRESFSKEWQGHFDGGSWVGREIDYLDNPDFNQTCVRFVYGGSEAHITGGLRPEHSVPKGEDEHTWDYYKCSGIGAPNSKFDVLTSPAQLAHLNKNEAVGPKLQDGAVWKYYWGKTRKSPRQLHTEICNSGCAQELASFRYTDTGHNSNWAAKQIFTCFLNLEEKLPLTGADVLGMLTNFVGLTGVGVVGDSPECSCAYS